MAYQITLGRKKHRDLTAQRGKYGWLPRKSKEKGISYCKLCEACSQTFVGWIKESYVRFSIILKKLYYSLIDIKR